MDGSHHGSITHGALRRLTAATGAALLVLASVAAMPDGASAETDLSGSWQTTYALACDAQFTQTGAQLTADIDCGLDLQGQLTGTIDPATGSFTLQGVVAALLDVTVEGDLSDDGASLDGTFSAPPFVPEGTFSANREVVVGVTDPDDLTGAWEATVSGIFSGNCTAEVAHTGAAVTVNADCGAVESLTGSYDEATRALSLMAGDVLNSDLVIEATVNEAGAAFAGTWTLTALDVSGVITGNKLVIGPPIVDGAVSPTPESTATVAPEALPDTGAGAGGGTPVPLAMALAASGLAALALGLRGRRA